MQQPANYPHQAGMPRPDYMSPKERMDLKGAGLRYILDGTADQQSSGLKAKLPQLLEQLEQQAYTKCMEPTAYRSAFLEKVRAIKGKILKQIGQQQQQQQAVAAQHAPPPQLQQQPQQPAQMYQQQHQQQPMLQGQRSQPYGAPMGAPMPQGAIPMQQRGMSQEQPLAEGVGETSDDKQYTEFLTSFIETPGQQGAQHPAQQPPAAPAAYHQRMASQGQPQAVAAPPPQPMHQVPKAPPPQGYHPMQGGPPPGYQQVVQPMAHGMRAPSGGLPPGYMPQPQQPGVPPKPMMADSAMTAAPGAPGYATHHMMSSAPGAPGPGGMMVSAQHPGAPPMPGLPQQVHPHGGMMAAPHAQMHGQMPGGGQMMAGGAGAMPQYAQMHQQQQQQMDGQPQTPQQQGAPQYMAQHPGPGQMMAQGPPQQQHPYAQHPAAAQQPRPPMPGVMPPGAQAMGAAAMQSAAARRPPPLPVQQQPGGGIAGAPGGMPALPMPVQQPQQHPMPGSYQQVQQQQPAPQQQQQQQQPAPQQQQQQPLHQIPQHASDGSHHSAPAEPAPANPGHPDPQRIIEEYWKVIGIIRSQLFPTLSVVHERYQNLPKERLDPQKQHTVLLFEDLYKRCLIERGSPQAAQLTIGPNDFLRAKQVCKCLQQQAEQLKVMRKNKAIQQAQQAAAAAAAAASSEVVSYNVPTPVSAQHLMQQQQQAMAAGGAGGYAPGALEQQHAGRAAAQQGATPGMYGTPPLPQLEAVSPPNYGAPQPGMAQQQQGAYPRPMPQAGQPAGGAFSPPGPQVGSPPSAPAIPPGLPRPPATAAQLQAQQRVLARPVSGAAAVRAVQQQQQLQQQRGQPATAAARAGAEAEQAAAAARATAAAAQSSKLQLLQGAGDSAPLMVERAAEPSGPDATARLLGLLAQPMAHAPGATAELTTFLEWQCDLTMPSLPPSVCWEVLQASSRAGGYQHAYPPYAHQHAPAGAAQPVASAGSPPQMPACREVRSVATCRVAGMDYALAATPQQQAVQQPAASSSSSGPWGAVNSGFGGGRGLKRGRDHSAALERLEGVCREVECAMHGSVALRILLPGDEEGLSSALISLGDGEDAFLVECAVASADGGTPPPWKRLRMAVPASYPSSSPVPLFASFDSAYTHPYGRAVRLHFQAAMASASAADALSMHGLARLWHTSVSRLCEGPGSSRSRGSGGAALASSAAQQLLAAQPSAAATPLA